MSSPIAINRETIAGCHGLIRPYIRKTPTVTVDAVDFGLQGGHLSLKLEQLQHAGAFKTRGAFANLLMRDVPSAGIAAASGGNHGAAVAYAAKTLGHKAKIFVPEISSPAKIQRIRDYGADLVVQGERYADALALCEQWIGETGALSVHAFDQDETMLGQGTIGMELEEQVQDVDTVLVAVGGGGLIAGIAAWFDGRAHVVGVEPSASPTLTKALEAGGPVDANAGGLAADSLAPRRIGAHSFEVIAPLVRKTILVEDDAIRTSQQMLWDMLRIVVEPGGAAAFSALLSGAYAPAPDERLCVIISGGNTPAVSFPA